MTSASRADARRNRARVLAAAEAVFATSGAAASTEEIARTAGVGVGTVFRHFPTKAALLEAIFAQRLQRLNDELQALNRADNVDPGAALVSLFVRLVDQAATKKLFSEALGTAGLEARSTQSPEAEEFKRLLGELLAHAQAAGAVRRDIDITGLLALVVGASRAAEFLDWDPALKVQAVSVILDGLRPDAGRIGP